LARIIYIRFVYGIIGREFTIYTVIYGVYIRFWPTLITSKARTQMQEAWTIERVYAGLHLERPRPVQPHMQILSRRKHTYAHVYIYYTHKHTHSFTCAHTNTFMHLHIYTLTHIPSLTNTRTRARARAHTHTHIYIQTHTHTHASTCSSISDFGTCKRRT
jgi:hypothetical protein